MLKSRNILFGTDSVLLKTSTKILRAFIFADKKIKQISRRRIFAKLKSAKINFKKNDLLKVYIVFYSCIFRWLICRTWRSEKGYKFQPLREKCPNTELFQVRFFLYLVRMQENTDQKWLRIWTLFTQCTSYCDVKLKEWNWLFSIESRSINKKRGFFALCRGVFRTQSKIYVEAFLRKLLRTFSW